jgi:hypothetical protein
MRSVSRSQAESRFNDSSGVGLVYVVLQGASMLGVFFPRNSPLPDDSLGRDNRYEALMENNVRVSDPILEAMSREAQRTGVDVNGLFDEAAKQLLAHREVDELAAIGERHARRRGLKPSDSVRLVREDRNQQRSR